MVLANATKAGPASCATNASQVITDPIAPNAHPPAPLTDSVMMASRATGNATALPPDGAGQIAVNVPQVITELIAPCAHSPATPTDPAKMG